MPPYISFLKTDQQILYGREVDGAWHTPSPCTHPKHGVPLPAAAVRQSEYYCRASWELVTVSDGWGWPLVGWHSCKLQFLFLATQGTSTKEH